MGSYDALASEYDNLYSNVSCTRENSLVRAMLAGLIPPGSSVVDIGCGTGLLLDLMKGHIAGYVGVDPSAGMLSVLARKYPDAKVVNSTYEAYSQDDTHYSVSLFGSPSYVSPEIFAINCKNNYFLMFYRDGYEPISHLKGVDSPTYPLAQSIANLPGASCIPFAQYVIVTDLGV